MALVSASWLLSIWLQFSSVIVLWHNTTHKTGAGSCYRAAGLSTTNAKYCLQIAQQYVFLLIEVCRLAFVKDKKSSQNF